MPQVSSLLTLSASAAALFLVSCSSSTVLSKQGTTPPLSSPVITWPQPAAISVDTPLGPGQLNATANVAGAFSYMPAAGATLQPGLQTLSATFTPADSARYSSTSATVNIRVNGPSAVITWPVPAEIDATTPLGPAQLNAKANTPGKFVYSPAYGTLLTAGAHTLSVTFTPDSANFSPGTASVNVHVTPSFACNSAATATASSFVYLASTTGHAPQATITGFAVAPDGSLSPVPNTRVPTSGIGSTTAIGNSLIGTDGFSLYSYAVHPDGCLSFERQLQAGTGDPANYYYGPIGLFTDATGSTLYSFVGVPPQGGYYASYSFDAASGAMAQTSTTGFDIGNGWHSLAFPADNKWGVGSNASIRGGRYLPIYQHLSYGSLSPSQTGEAPMPDLAEPSGIAADHSNHFVVAMSQCSDAQTCDNVLPWKLAVYTMDASGSITANDNWASMTKIPGLTSTEVYPRELEFSPDNKYLAVSSFASIDVFAWDADTLTLRHVATINNAYGMCQTGPGWQGCQGDGYFRLGWGSNDHLFAPLGGRLFVFAVTPSAVTQAPGSPWTAPYADWVTVINFASVSH